MKRNPEIKSEPDSSIRNKIKLEGYGRPTSRPTKYPTLRPKPPPSSLPSKNDCNTDTQKNVTLGPLRRCRVKLCPLKVCHLRSHRSYVVPSKRARDRKSPKIPQPLERLSIIQGGVDGLPALPLDGVDPPVYQQLFHSYFHDVYDRVTRLLVPPPLTTAQRSIAAEGKRRAIAMALSSPIYCLHAIAAAHHQVVFQRDYRRPDRNTILIHGKIMTLLRAKLDHFDHEEIGELISVILILVMFEISTGKIKSLAAHHGAVQLLVSRYGGVHKMKGETVMILTLDRILSIFTCRPPLYTPPDNCLIRKPAVTSPSYGTYFEYSSTCLNLGQDIGRYCQDVCRAIEILEWQGWTFDPGDPPIAQSPNLHYFFFLRDCVVNEFVRLNVCTAGESNVARCVLLTTKIVEYTTLMDNYFVTIPIELANRVQVLICQNETEENYTWSDQQSLFVWILFVLTSMSDPWDNRPWAMNLLRTQLETKYHGPTWPVEWREYENDNVREFVWSDTRFQSGFAKTCNELQFLKAESADSSRLVLLSTDEL